MLCDFQVWNYLPKIAQFDKVLFCLFYRWPRSKINCFFKDILILTVAGRVVNKVKIISFGLISIQYRIFNKWFPKSWNYSSKWLTSLTTGCTYKLYLTTVGSLTSLPGAITMWIRHILVTDHAVWKLRMCSPPKTSFTFVQAATDHREQWRDDQLRFKCLGQPATWKHFRMRGRGVLRADDNEELRHIQRELQVMGVRLPAWRTGSAKTVKCENHIAKTAQVSTSHLTLFSIMPWTLCRVHPWVTHYLLLDTALGEEEDTVQAL